MHRVKYCFLLWDFWMQDFCDYVGLPGIIKYAKWLSKIIWHYGQPGEKYFIIICPEIVSWEKSVQVLNSLDMSKGLIGGEFACCCCAIWRATDEVGERDGGKMQTNVVSFPFRYYLCGSLKNSTQLHHKRCWTAATNRIPCSGTGTLRGRILWEGPEEEERRMAKRKGEQSAVW